MTRPSKHAPFDPPPEDKRSAGADKGAGSGAPPSRWQFGLPALLGTMLLLCLPFAIWGAILRANPHEEMVLMLLCIATPLGVMVLAALTVSLGRALRRLWRRNDGE